MFIREISTDPPVLESFDQPYDYEVVDSNDEEFLAKFKTDAGKSVVFAAAKAPIWIAYFLVNGDTDITGGGEQFRIFATVIKIFKDFVDRYNPEVVDFEARKSQDGNSRNSRINLYTRMVKKLATSEGYKFEIRDSGIDVRFSLTKAGSKS